MNWRWLYSGLLRRVFWQKFTDVSEVLPASIIRAIALMMEAASTSQTSVNSYQTTTQKTVIFILAGRENLKFKIRFAHVFTI
jgi:hypothetical protein